MKTVTKGDRAHENARANSVGRDAANMKTLPKTLPPTGANIRKRCRLEEGVKPVGDALVWSCGNLYPELVMRVRALVFLVSSCAALGWVTPRRDARRAR